MSYEVCNTIHLIDKLIWTKRKGAVEVVEYNQLLKPYCPLNDLGKNVCRNYDEMISSSVLLFLKWLEMNYNYEDDLKNDKLAEYAILWLCYKLNEDPQEGITTLNDFYAKHIEKNKHYNEKITKSSDKKTYKDIIDRKHDLMNVNIEEISKFYDAFKSLCDMYTECNESKLNCTKCSQKANEFAGNFEELNGDPNITGNNSYQKILSTLFDDYDNLKKICDNDQSSNFPTLSPVKTSQSFEDLSSSSSMEIIQSPALSPEATSSSSSIASKLIPALLIFAIPFFLGIAYKYSLFGFDKRFQRQYIREKIKKIKSKMNHYI
ncbi:PIR protein CIR protein [Plasmodium vinckei]|uniref:PIR protein CIR protein n=1 Tax=Plasmodium vinckei TaxID=5860 RepID=A0A6V7SEI1_PLAVN|nr:PIR protein CIR protein [Plasmodium vinckei]